ncbi:MAG: hypothetical protein LBL96_02760 [Clostridiales bacterium]|jgi:hypothetical protein|nr:hypothetical protein [Clostridiales bacterium]
MMFTESDMLFDFSALESAEQYDTPANQCAGLKIVDFIAEDSDKQLFIEVKNFANTSANKAVQVAMDKRRTSDYLMLTNPIAAFPLEMGMKFKDSLFRWLASGKKFRKPIALLLVINPPKELRARDRERLIRRIRGYIPSGMTAEQYPKMTSAFFDMQTPADVEKYYGFSVVVKARYAR